MSFYQSAQRYLEERNATPETDESDGHAERRTTPRPCLAIAAEAGIGKTEEALRGLLSPYWQGKRVLYLVPSIDLAEELAERAREIGLPEVHVIRGRSQPNPATPGETMCRKAVVAERMAALGYNVTETMCVGKDAEGKEVECEFRSKCAYFQQLQARKNGPGLLIGAHAYLSIAMEMLRQEKVDLLIIDESFWQTLVRHSSVSIDRFTTPRKPGFGAGKYRAHRGEKLVDAELRAWEDAEEFEKVQKKAVAAIRAASDVKRGVTLADFRAAGLSSGDARFAAGVEYTRLGRAEIHPGMSFEAQDAASLKAANREAFALARIWKCLAEELETERQGAPMSVRLEYDRLNRKTETLENLVTVDYSAEARFQAVPTLIIDADADPVLLERFYSGVTVETVAATWSGVRVRQVTDRTGSKLAFSNVANQDRVRAIAGDLAAQLAPRIDNPSKRPLVVVQKAVREAWQEQGHALDYDGETPNTTAPFRVAHFGNTRGKDDWKHTTAAIIVGRIEPSPRELERMARAVFYKYADALAELRPDDRNRVVLPRRRVVMTARDGSSATVSVSYHPDDRADRILRQVREAEINQAIARVRPVHRSPEAPCEVLILTNVPGRVEPDTFATWAEIVPDRFRLMELRGFLPDLAPDCAAAFPDLWDSADAVRQAASRLAAAKCDASYERDIYRGCHTFEGSVRVEYRREGNRRGRQATVAARPGDTAETIAQRVRDALPDAFAVVLLGPLPDPIEAAQAALDAAIELDAYIEEVEAGGGVIWWRVPPETRRQPSRWNAARPVQGAARRHDPGGAAANPG